MIAANVAAAETLEAQAPALHVPRPRRPRSREVRGAAGVRRAASGLSLARGQVIRPAVFARLLEQARRTPYAAMINELVLRSQAQAVYSPENLGHFGLALRRYCHFTSPIRRYADLLVHRALITAHGFGEDGLRPDGRRRLRPARRAHLRDRAAGGGGRARCRRPLHRGLPGRARRRGVRRRHHRGDPLRPVRHAQGIRRQTASCRSAACRATFYDHDEHRHSPGRTALGPRLPAGRDGGGHGWSRPSRSPAA